MILLAPVAFAVEPFLYWPVENDNTRITSGWTYASGGCHRGLDIDPATEDVLVLAAADGTVEFDATTDDNQPNTWATGVRTYGNKVQIVHPNGFRTIYGHLKSGTVVVSDGQQVVAGQPLATFDNSGYSSGSHLHFEVRDSAGAKVDPYAIYGGPSAYPGAAMVDAGPSTVADCASGDVGYLWMQFPPRHASLSLTGELAEVTTDGMMLRVLGSAGATDGIDVVSLTVGEVAVASWDGAGATEVPVELDADLSALVQPGTYTLALWVRDERGVTSPVDTAEIVLDAGIYGSISLVEVDEAILHVEGEVSADAGLERWSLVVGASTVYTYGYDEIVGDDRFDALANLADVQPGEATLGLWVRDATGVSVLVDTAVLEVPEVDAEPLAEGEGPVADSAIALYATLASSWAGSWVDAAGDVNRDGFADLLVGAPDTADDLGRSYLFYGPVTGDSDLEDADAIFEGELAGGFAGYPVKGVGDTDGDGYDDVLVGVSEIALLGSSAGPGPGAACLFLGPLAGDYGMSSADAAFSGEADVDFAGHSAGGGDIDGDGLADLVVGAYGQGDGVAYVLYGPFSGEIALSGADGRYEGEAGGRAGWVVSAAGDVDGDGLADVLVGAPNEERGDLNDAGAAYLVLGPAGDDAPLTDADATLLGEGEDDLAGGSVSNAADVNGDGYADVLVGAWWENGTEAKAGAAYVVLGPVSGEVDLADATAKLTGDAAGDQAGWPVNSAGDVDRDGDDDVLVGAQYRGDGEGAAYLVLGPITGSWRLSEAAQAVLVGPEGGYTAGSAGVGDTDGDGFVDFLVAAYSADIYAENGGVAYLVAGGP